MSLWLTCNAGWVAADGQDVQDALYEVSGSRTVPQVFVQGAYIGGADGECPADEAFVI